MELKFKLLYTFSVIGKSFNRTKWNWNVWWGFCCSCYFRLLIVLNGIEISFQAGNARFCMLLIVLNGIEMKFVIIVVLCLVSFNRTKWNWNVSSYLSGMVEYLLLIVLNGIEMQSYKAAYEAAGTFNRTKWNWNVAEDADWCHEWSFNRTKWNWNACFRFGSLWKS